MKYLYLVPFLAFATIVRSATNIDPVNPYAYGANVGWINLAGNTADGVVVGEAWLSGYAYGANFGWISFGDGLPDDGLAYGNDSDSDFGVNHDGAGNLSGMAYSANTGWINFGWAGAADTDRPRIDLLTGAFHGFAYGANIGWINLGAGYLTAAGLACPDEDEDGIGDWWEKLHFGNTGTADETTDGDKDGVLDVDEYRALTLPDDPTSFLRFVDASESPLDPAKMEVTVEFTSDPGRLYQIHHSGDLQAPYVDVGLGTFAADEGSTTTKTFTMPKGEKFLRAVPIKPLQP